MVSDQIPQGIEDWNLLKCAEEHQQSAPVWTAATAMQNLRMGNSANGHGKGAEQRIQFWVFAAQKINEDAAVHQDHGR